MSTQVLWTPLDAIGLESLVLSNTQTEILAHSVVIGITDGVPFRLSYAISCDRAWQMRAATVELLHQNHILQLQTDGNGNWFDGDDQPISALAGCSEIDISVTPFTNTLPIQRLNLIPGESAELAIAYITIPQMTVAPAPKRYTCLNADENGALYRYEGLSTGFTADILVDSEGLVVHYPEIFKRVWL